MNKSVEQCVESLCHKGCREVWCVIDALEQGQELAETKGLSDAEIAQVLKELKVIMSVYEGSCSAE